MKIIYITFFWMLGTFGSIAAEVQMPAALYGHWCQDFKAMDKASDYTTLLYNRKVGKRCPPEDSDDDNSIRISSQLTWGSDERKTKILSVVPRRNEWQITLQRSTEIRVPDQTKLDKLCPNPKVRCKVRDNPEFYREDPVFWLKISKPAISSWSEAEEYTFKLEGDGRRLIVSK